MNHNLYKKIIDKDNYELSYQNIYQKIEKLPLYVQVNPLCIILKKYLFDQTNIQYIDTKQPNKCTYDSHNLPISL